MPDFYPTISAPSRIDGLGWLYILQSADGSFYVGQTLDLAERLRKHRFGLGSKHTREHGNPRLIYYEGPMSLPAAVSSEAQLNGWSRAKKAALIRGDLQVLSALSQSRERRP